MAATREVFTSRWALVLAALGMAVGTGNIWRFPRVAAANGGGAFLIPWIAALFLWSIPMLMVEFALGKRSRRGPIGAVAVVLGPGKAWMGGFVGICTLAIMFYYSVVAGWCLRYFFLTLQGPLAQDAEVVWTAFAGSGSWWPVLFHGLALSLGLAIISRGVVGGIEIANRILIPSLFVLLVVAALRAVTLDGAGRGLEFLFHADLSRLSDVKVAPTRPTSFASRATSSSSRGTSSRNGKRLPPRGGGHIGSRSGALAAPRAKSPTPWP